MDAAVVASSVEAAAEHVLVAAGIEPIPATDKFVYLETAAGTHLPQLATVLTLGGGGGGNGVLTCTNPTPAAPRPASDVWNPLDAVDSSAAMTTLPDITMAEDDDVCLEDTAPFTPDFYRSFGELICLCLNGENNGGDGEDDSAAAAAAEQTRYSLLRDNDAVRAIRLLCALMEYNVGESDQMDDGEGTFLSLLLRHCEGNKSARPSTVGVDMDSRDQDGIDGNGDDDGNGGGPRKVRRIPVIGAIFRHLSSLPALEAYVRSWARRRRYPHSMSATGGFIAVDTTVTLANPQSTTTTTQLSSDAASDRLKSLKLWENEKERLEAELSNHIAMLEYVLGSIYRECDAELRGRCRTRLGGILHVFSLSSGGGPTPMMRLGVSSSGVGGSAAAIGALGGSGAMGVEDASAAGIDAALKVLLRIVEGIDRSSPLGPAHEALLFDVLLPLHKPSGMVLWRDQTPVLGLYHETLVRCVGAVLVRNKQSIAKAVRALLHPDNWPTEGGVQGRSRGGGANGGGGVGVVANTPKVVLLLHEVDTYLGLLGIAGVEGHAESRDNADDDESNVERNALISSFSETILPLTARLASCIESDNSRTSERALQYFRNKNFAVLIRRYKEIIMPVLLRALCRFDAGMQVPWNPTVRKMTLLVLTEMEAIDGALFRKSCEDAFGPRTTERAMKFREKVEATASHVGTAVVGVGASTAGNVTQDMTSLRGGMGTWRPPSGVGATVGRGTRALRGGGGQPPLTVTGVAPWAAPSGAGATPKQPPLTVTGVAPWAVGGAAAGTGKNATLPRRSAGQRLPSKTKQPGRGMAPWAIQQNSNAPSASTSMGPPVNKRKTSPHTSVNEKSSAGDRSSTKNVTDPSVATSSADYGIKRVRRFMEDLKPPKVEGEEDNDGGVSSWAKAQMAESPTLLPSLKFHDLVFGQNLGEGSFGSVRYARQIVKERTRSYWPEFAVKIVSTEKIAELGYEQSINREIAILRTMSHPGIARLISTFRFRDGAYLVLEYASGGDLHSLLKRNGSIDHASAQFVIGEIVAALCSIHDAGFVFGDLKPENILITESGHVKLTDFGGCRPYTDQAKELVKLSSKNLIEMLRDGDWRETSPGNSLKKSHVESSDDLDGAKFLDDDSADDDGGNEDADDTDEDDTAEEDFRIEGTTAYLPPEVVVGGIPSTSADSWALGCVLYQCISGRPPILEDTDHLTRNRIVTFELTSQKHEEDFFGIHDESTFQPDAKELICKLLSRDPHGRPGMHSVAHDNFFEGKDVFALNKEEAYPLDVGKIAPVVDAKWNRRQFSSIWAPQPKQYAIDALGSADGGGSTAWEKERNSPIREGAERDAHFLSTRRPIGLMKIGE